MSTDRMNKEVHDSGKYTEPSPICEIRQQGDRRLWDAYGNRLDNSYAPTPVPELWAGGRVCCFWLGGILQSTKVIHISLGRGG